MKSSEQLGELFAALAKAQAEMDVALKDSSNPHFNSKFADLKSVVSVSRPALTKNNLCVTQPPVKEEWGAVLVTILGHSSGQWISSEIEIKPMKKMGKYEKKEDFIPGPDDDPQKIGGFITYMRRYAYASIVGVVAEDDDGEAASGRGEYIKKHHQKIDDIMKTIRLNSNDPNKIYGDMLKKFNISHHYKLSEESLFDALNWIMEQVQQERTNNTARIDVESRN